MVDETVTREFSFEAEDTCKQTWRFSLRQGAGGWIVEDLQIEDREQPVGCGGHPRTIAALVKGRPVKSIDVDALAEAARGRSMACGQALARCLRQIMEE